MYSNPRKADSAPGGVVWTKARVTEQRAGGAAAMWCDHARCRMFRGVGEGVIDGEFSMLMGVATECNDNF